MRPIVIAAGGTGGHFFPAEALAAELVKRGRRVALMTDARSGALTSPVFSNTERFVLSGAGIAGRGPLRGALAIAALAAGTSQARAILARLDAAVLVGFGGYPSVAPVLAARLLRHRPAIVLHEQNAVLGRANRFLSRHANTLALSHADTQLVPPGARSTITGNPVRPAIAALAGMPYVAPGETINLLVLGGSLGARVFSDVVPPALAALQDSLRTRIRVTQQCRLEDLERVRSAFEASDIEAELAAFFPDIAARIARAHIVVARAGASTVAELAVAGRPAILVPLPGAIDDHQTANARALAGATMLPQSLFVPETLTARLQSLLAAPGTLAAAAARAAASGRPQAASTLADLVEALVPGDILA